MDGRPRRADAIGSIAALARAQARERPLTAALTAGDRRLTFAELDLRSNQVAGALVAAGIGAGDRVAYLGKNSLEFFELLFGASKVGAVTVPLNWRLTAQEIAQIVDDSTAAVVVVGAEHVAVVASVADALAAVRLLVALGSEGGLRGAVPYGDWAGATGTEDPGHMPAADDVALQLYTSGTTGRPKGAMLTNRNVWSMLPATARDWGFGTDSVNLVALPIFHVGGVGWALVGLFAGASSIVLPEFAVGAVLEAISMHGVTHVVLVPAVLPALLDAADSTGSDVSSLRTIVYGAAPISESVLARAVQQLTCGFIQGYGLTETVGAVIHLLEADHDLAAAHRHRLRAAGRPMEGVEVRIVDPASGCDVETGAVGEIWLRTPRVMLGYWNQPEATRRAITSDGWLRSGDAGHVDDDGYVYLSDRVKDMIISGGENIYPAEVENVLMGHPAVADVAVIGVPSERWGETPKALVVPVPGTPPGEDELIAFCRARVAHYKCPTSVELVDTLPRNATGKVLKAELRAAYWDQRERNVN
jgi:acyl-CoA synthetase (AMP-forming)/AMP-acid ligase II